MIYLDMSDYRVVYHRIYPAQCDKANRQPTVWEYVYDPFISNLGDLYHKDMW